jgi:hypothetical protein|nr:hypothetical protein [Candidatus Krumholzibacteria bacterium]
MNRNTSHVLVLLGTLLLLGMIAACDDSDDPCAPLVPAGRIEGQVLTGGMPSTATIVATPVDGLEGYAIEYDAELDFYGNYSLDLPAGQYTLGLRVNSHRYTYDYCGDEIGYGNLIPEILTIDNGTILEGIDFPLASMYFDISLSDMLEGEELMVRLHLRNATETGAWRTYLKEVTATITDGQVFLNAVGVLPGEYQVELILGRVLYFCDCPFDGEHIWMPGVRDQQESPWYTVATDTRVELAAALPSQTGRIEGRVSGAWLDLGLEAPEFSLFTPDSTVVMGRRRIMDTEGYFGADLHLPGPVKVLVTQMGVENWVGGSSIEEATEFDIQPGQVATGADLVQGGMLVQVASLDFELDEAEIRFHDAGTQEHLNTVSFVNMFELTEVGIANLEPGDYLAHVTPRLSSRGRVPWRPQWFDRAVQPGAAQTITVSQGGDVVSVTLNLELGGVIRGGFQPDLEDGDWQYVVVTPADDPAIWGNGSYFPEHQTNFQIQGLPDGAYKLGAFSTGLGWSYGDPYPAETIWYGGATWDTATVITIEDAAEVTGLVIEL